MEQVKFDILIEQKRQGKFKEAETGYKKALENQDYDPRVFTALGKIFFLEDDYQHAINSFMIFFTINRKNGYAIGDFPSELFHVFMAIIRNTDFVAMMEQNGIDGGDIIWRLRNADSVCAYKNAICGKPNTQFAKGIDYGKAGQSLLMLGSNQIDDQNYMKARDIFENTNNEEKDFIINSIKKSTDQYRDVPLFAVIDQIIMK